MMFTAVLIAVLIGNVGSVLAASLMLRIKDEKLHRYLKNINAFAGGTLLGAAFIGMLPKAIQITGYTISYYVLGGILFFFLLEKIMLWRMCSEEHCERREKASALMLMVGDTFHNCLDGVTSAAAFMYSQSFGIVMAFSIFAHELPQEIGDVGVMVHSGFSKRKAIMYNVYSGLAAIVGAVLALYAGSYTQHALPFILAFSAAGLLYIALADLIPELHHKANLSESVLQLALLLLGIGVIILSVV
jgi:zinc and cadmium transporter